MALKARTTQVVFDQWLLSDAGEPLAHAEVVCLCIDSDGKICPAPPAVTVLLEGWLAKQKE